MLSPQSFAIVLLFLLAGIPAVTQQTKSAEEPNRIQIRLDDTEAESVLAILDKNALRTPLTDNDWKRLFETEPYIRLKQREAAMHRDFTDDDFKKFVLSPELTAKATSLRHTLDAWKRADLQASARRVLSYLPAQATIRAKVFPEIKPKTNSFVFDSETNPAIFLYLDPEESAPKFENTVAHELHHIGYRERFLFGKGEETQCSVQRCACRGLDGRIRRGVRYARRRRRARRRSARR